MLVCPGKTCRAIPDRGHDKKSQKLNLLHVISDTIIHIFYFYIPADFGPPMRGRKSLDFSTPGTAHVRSRVADINASLNESLTLHPLDSVSDADESCAELQSQTNPTSTGKENVDCNAQSGTLSRKRRSDDMYGAPSDDEDALLIDAEIPEMGECHF